MPRTTVAIQIQAPWDCENIPFRLVSLPTEASSPHWPKIKRTPNFLQQQNLLRYLYA